MSQRLARDGAAVVSAFRETLKRDPKGSLLDELLVPFISSNFARHFKQYDAIGVPRMPAVEGYLALGCWAVYGFPTFVLDESLTAQFVLTDPHVPAGHTVQFPFPTFHVRVPEGFFYTTADDGTQIPFDTISYHEIDDFSVQEDYRQYTAEMRARVDDGSDEPIATEHIARILERHHNDFAVDWIKQRGRRSAYVHLVAGSASLTAAIRRRQPAISNATDINRWINGSANEAPMTAGKVDFDHEDLCQVRVASRVLVNLALYLEHVKNPTRKAFALPIKVGNRKVQPHFFAVEHKTKIAKQLIDLAKESARVPKARVQWQLQHKFIVRGHWRNQAYGPNRSLRTMKWIAPFWKGPDNAFAAPRTYALKA